ncbi:MAG: flagellar brake domain-containing protein [Eubacteriales bacterium]
MIENLKIGDRIEIRPIDYMITHNRSVYLSQIAEIHSETRIEITMPTVKARMVLLQVGHEYETIYITSKGLFHVKIKVKERCRENNIYTAVIDFTTELQRHQRREYFRYICNLDVSTIEISKEDSRKFEVIPEMTSFEITPTKGVMLDIGGGGVRFVIPNSLQRDGMALMHFKLRIEDELHEFTILGSVVKITEMPIKPKLYEHRVRFEWIEDTTREMIIKYVFEEEHKLLKKNSGLLDD